MHDFRDFRTIDIKIIPSKSDNGEVILWLDGEKKVELYGTNFTIGNAFTFKLGQYKFFEGTSASSVKTSSLFIKKFGYDKKCEIILSQNQCSYSSTTRQSYSKLFGSNSSRRDRHHGKKVAKSIKFKKELPGFNIKFDENIFFFLEETRPRVETEGMTLPQPPESAGQKRRFSRKISERTETLKVKNKNMTVRLLNF